MPNPDVLDALLDCYIAVRAKSRKNVSFADTIASGTTYLTQKLSGQPDDKQITNLIDDVKKQFRPKDRHRQQEGVQTITFDEWIDAIKFLGDKAFVTQSKKITGLSYFTEKESLLCLTFHALRNYIVVNLVKEYPQEFSAKLTTIKNHFNELEARAAKSAYQNLDISLTVDDANKDLLLLALLEDKASIYQANQRNLFEQLYHLDNNPKNCPRCFQEDFCKVLYEERFQSLKNISFTEFESQTIKRSKIKQRSTSSPSLNPNLAQTPIDNPEQYSPRVSNQ